MIPQNIQPSTKEGAIYYDNNEKKILKNTTNSGTETILLVVLREIIGHCRKMWNSFYDAFSWEY
jgi:hypothetical protein